MSVVARLAELGVTIPKPAAPAGSYVPAVRTGNLIFTSGQLPFADGTLAATGKVGGSVSPEDAQKYARLCTVNALAALASVVDLDSIVRVVKLSGFVASEPGFTGQSTVINGASDFLAEVFGEAGKHARAAVGMAELPLGSPVELELIVEVRD